MTQNVVTCTFDFISYAHSSRFLFIADVKKKKDTSAILILLSYLFRQKDKLRGKYVRQYLTALQASLIQYNTTISAVSDSSYAVIKSVQIRGCNVCKEQDSHYCMKGTRFIYFFSSIPLK